MFCLAFHAFKAKSLQKTDPTHGLDFTRRAEAEFHGRGDGPLVAKRIEMFAIEKIENGRPMMVMLRPFQVCHTYLARATPFFELGATFGREGRSRSTHTGARASPRF